MTPIDSWPPAARFEHGETLSEVPLFPLPDVVLFPSALLPLHVFEPRYRAMVEFAAQGRGLIAVPQLAPGWQQQYLGAPALLPVFGLGQLLRKEDAGGGRYNVLIRGLHRVRLLEEEAGDRPFRVARVVVLDGGPPTNPAALATLMPTVRQLFAAAAGALPGLGDDAVSLFMAPGADAASVLDAIALTVPLSGAERQSVLSEAEPAERASLLIELLAGWLVAHDAAPAAPDQAD